MVRKGGLEPPHLTAPDPKSGASANSATFAQPNEKANKFPVWAQRLGSRLGKSSALLRECHSTRLNYYDNDKINEHINTTEARSL